MRPGGTAGSRLMESLGTANILPADYNLCRKVRIPIGSMKIIRVFSPIASVVLASALLSPAALVAQTAGQDMHNAGTDTKNATTDTGHAVKHQARIP